FYRDVVMTLFESERAGHAAAAGVEVAMVEAEPVHQCVVRAFSYHRMMITVKMHDGFTLNRRQRRALTLEKLRKGYDPSGKRARFRPVRKEIGEFVPEGRYAARLDADDGRSFVDRRSKG